MMPKKVKGKGHQYPAQGRVRVRGFFFPKRGGQTIPGTLKEEVKKDACSQETPQLTPNSGRTPNLLLYMMPRT